MSSVGVNPGSFLKGGEPLQGLLCYWDEILGLPGGGQFWYLLCSVLMVSPLGEYH